MKDIFIDNNIAKNFATPLDKNYKDLIDWLNNYDEESVKKDSTVKDTFAHLVVSQKLLKEYLDSSKNSSKPNAIPSLINRLIIQGRLIKKTKNEIEDFTNKHFTKTITRKLLSNEEDHCHIVTVLLSQRKICLTYDKNLTKDLDNFPGFNPIVKKRPEEINYK